MRGPMCEVKLPMAREEGVMQRVRIQENHPVAQARSALRRLELIRRKIRFSCESTGRRIQTSTINTLKRA